MLPADVSTVKQPSAVPQAIKETCSRSLGTTSPEPRTEHYRTIIRDEITKKPNFAGCWRVVEIGCGISCQQILVVHPETETVIRGPTASYGARYILDSKILVVNPADVLAENNADALPWAKTRTYVLDHRKSQLKRVNN